jgi:SAM-dependent methyltransferase
MLILINGVNLNFYASSLTYFIIRMSLTSKSSINKIAPINAKSIGGFMSMFFLLIQLVYRIALSAPVSHTEIGTEYGDQAIIGYAESNHGPDGALFLDPYFKPALENLNNKTVLDAGCGAAPWAIYAAKHGGQVYAIDIQEGMIEAAKKAVSLEQLTDRISVSKGDVAMLPYASDFFDRAISICVGCNLPLTSFDKHFQEFERILKKEGIAVIGAPASLDVVFSNGTKSDLDVQSHIQEILSQLPDEPTPEIIAKNLSQLEEVLSATFYMNGNRLALLKDERELKEGENIWRKLPKVVIPNRYYSKDFYIKIFRKYRLDIEKIDLPHFLNENDRIRYNNAAPNNFHLGKEYTSHAPFVIFHLKKKGGLKSSNS